MRTDEDDEEIEYGDWKTFDAETVLSKEKKKYSKQDEDIWPHWSNGIPTQLRRTSWAPSFFLGRVHHKMRLTTESLELDWNTAHTLAELEAKKRLLPSTYASEWSGVYRLFAENTVIERCCGSDPTGTLYIGKAGSKERSWSILRTRIKSFVNRSHTALYNWNYIDAVKIKFPWESLAVEWAYTGKRLNYKGESIFEASMAEGWLLSCYNDSFGELPPWNIRSK